MTALPEAFDKSALPPSPPHLDAAIDYVRRGWSPVPIPAGEKGPRRRDWQMLRIDESLIAQTFNRPSQNVGVILGPASGGLTDIDLDCPEACAAASYFLPRTGAIFGRATARNSHWLYVSDLASSYPSAVCMFADPTVKADDDKKATLLEVRIGGVAGAQTVFPGSMHKDTGEAIEWEQDGEPAAIDGDMLMRRAERLAACTLFARHWPPHGRRHEPRLMVAGVLARAGMSESEANVFVEALARAIGDEDVSDAKAAVRSTFKRVATDEAFTGVPRLADVFGDAVARCVVDWLHVDDSPICSGAPMVDVPIAPRTIVQDGVTIDAETGEIIDNAGAKENPRVELEIVRASEFAGRPIPPRRWHVENLIPCANVTTLSGDGGTGKSLLALQLCEATARGGEWIGLKPEPGKALFVSAEDEIEEVHRRLADINPAFDQLGNLLIVPLAGQDAILAAPEGRDGLLKETPLFGALQRAVDEHAPALLVLDTLADLFGGDEIKKIHARQFIAMLRGLALRYDVAIVLLAHPSQSGINNETGTSGNTAWSNSVRSRLYFKRESKDDPDLRVLEAMKANRAPIGGKIFVRYRSGEFVREKMAESTGDIGREVERVFLNLLEQFERDGRTVSPSKSSSFAPAVFSRCPDAKGISKDHLHRAMERLFHQQKIKVVEFGPPSKRRQKIVAVSAAETASANNHQTKG